MRIRRGGSRITSGTGSVVVNPDGTITITGDVEIDDAFNHDGSTFGALGATPQAQQATIVDADGTLADITTKFNVLLADLEGFGFHATS